MKDALQDLLQTLEAAATEAGVVTGLVDSINKSIIKVKIIYAYYFLIKLCEVSCSVYNY